MVMQTTDDWRLKIEHWPYAVEASVCPQPCVGFSLGDDPAHYRPHEIDFSQPPSREDFLAVVARSPWMDTWKDDLLPLLAKSEWPQITLGHKAARVDLLDDTGRCIGRIEVTRRTRYCNALRPTLGLWTYTGSELDRLLKRRIRDVERREQAREHIDRHRHLIVERAARTADPSDAAVLIEVERLLTEGGFLKRHRRAA